MATQKELKRDDIHIEYSRVYMYQVLCMEVADILLY